MADVDEDVVSADETILYDLSLQSEWCLENDILTRTSRERDKASIVGRVASATQRTAWTFLRTLGVPLQTPTPCLLPESLVKLVSSQINWHIAVSSEGSLVAVLQEHCVDIRSRRDGYESVFGRGSFPRDPYPQWRCVRWTPDSTMVACSRSGGAVDVFDIVGTLLFTIPSTSPENIGAPQDLSSAVASLIFTDTKPTDQKWSSELLIVNYHGSLRSYYVNRDSGFKLHHSFVFNQEYPRGVGSVVYHAKHRLLLVGGCGRAGDSEGSVPLATREGITAWRILSDYPHYKLVTEYDEGLQQLKKSRSIISRLRLPQLTGWATTNVDGVYKLCLSPSGDVLVALHHSGKLSLWEVPSLRQRQAWKLEDQPAFDDICEKLAEHPQKRKRLKDLIPHKKLLDVNFWSNEALITARCTGAVTVSSVNTLKNLLGNSPEWFEPSPRVSETHEGGFIGIECEVQFPKKKLVASGDSDDYDDSDDEEGSWVTKTTRYTKQVLFYLTDSDKFQPPRKKPKLVTRLYRLIWLKSTTPEELYARKIDGEEYGEALALAKAYKLDCDLVYQRQWRKSPVSVASIQDYLSKISKRSWVLHECLERVPDSVDAMRELLEYALRGTDLPALILIGKWEDGGRFILSDPEEGLYEDMDFDEFNPESLRQKEELKQQRIQELLEQVNFKELNLEQKELCRARLKLLQYLDRLKTYEYILGGATEAAERFDAKFFKNFRAQNIVETALEYAQMSDVIALDALFTYHGKNTLPHRLAILSHFPETTSPVEYKCLLPEVGTDNTVVIWEEYSWRDPDWCEEDFCRSAVDPNPEDLGAFLYEAETELEKFRSTHLSSSLLTDWFVYRACEIERLSRMVDNAMELVKMGIQRGVEGLMDLLDDFLTMEMLVYECNVDDSLTFTDLQQMADYDKLDLIMSKSSREMYHKNLRRWLVPFLKLCNRRVKGSYDSLLHDYIVTLARSDLTLIAKIFDSSKATVSQPIVTSSWQLMTWAMEAIYTCERDDQLDLAYDIIRCLPQANHSKDSPEMRRLHREVDKLENHLSAAKILQTHDIKKPVSYVRDTENDADEAKNLFIKLTRLAGRKTPSLTESQWHKLHADVLELQNKVYRCIPASVCHEIFVQSLLCSSRVENIRLAGEMMERSASEANPVHGPATPTRVEYERAVQLVLSSAQEYFNSSADLMDSCMDLARSCLHLILDTPPAIQDELDLIASLALLDDFGVSVLPLQVRLNKERVSLVREAVSNRPVAYKQMQKLLRLGHLLKISGETEAERDGNVLSILAEAAIKAKDYQFATDCCHRLMDTSFGPAWSVCIDLAAEEDFDNISAKVDLFLFAMTYCSPDMIEPILQAKCQLETRMLYEDLTVTIGMDKHEDDLGNSPESSPFTAKAAIMQTRQILSSTTKTTRAMLSTVTDRGWWQGAIHAMKKPTQRSVSVEEHDDKNCKFNRQGCHPFYDGIIDDCYSNISAVNYRTGEKGSEMETQISENMLRTAKLEEMLTEGELAQPASEVLLELAKSTIARDSTLGLAYLLALPQSTEAEKCFEEFPSTDISLQLALYYYALQIYSSLKPSSRPAPYVLYTQPPAKIIKRVVDHVTTRQNITWPGEVLDLIPKLKSYQEMLADYNQAKSLQVLRRGIDVIRFTEDHEYRQETILGLAMSLDDECYSLAVSLADRYSMSLWDVYMTHLEFLFTDSGLSTEEVEERVKSRNILPELVKKPADFCSRLYKYVFPTIDGTDHPRFLYFFSLLSGLESDVIHGLVPSDHVKLLKKLKSVTPGLDYQLLIDETHSPVDVLQPFITGGNVNVLAKLANKIPDGNGGFLQASTVYASWAVKYFWEGDQSTKKPESNATWIHRYESCRDLLLKLLPEDFLRCTGAILFTEQARTKLEVYCRQEIAKRALKFSRQQASDKKKKQEKTGNVSWDDVCETLQRQANHLKTLDNDVIKSFCVAQDGPFKTYVTLYDLSAGDEHQLKNLLIRMVLDGQSVELVDDMLQVAPLGFWSARTVVQEAVKLVAEKLRDPSTENALISEFDALPTLELIVHNVQEHEQNKGDLVRSEDVTSLLRPFCSDGSVAVQPRLDVLHILEKSLVLSDEDRVLLSFYRTDALVSSAWHDIKISESDLLSADSRQKLYETLLSSCSSVDHFWALCQVLNMWPQHRTEETKPSEHPWVRLFVAIVKTNDAQMVKLVNRTVQEIWDTSLLIEQHTRHVFDELLTHDFMIKGVQFILTVYFSTHATCLMSC
ncbi:neuroblastoma-amplified sequence-like isoform X2 [Gigantopelta aegis]|uniref:neuroblastoma-amplified sequence-like isoform X2 n=1 Tax=Gigantopelta aegis TaxID=1735272 RepID=UPI001B88C175|nr:neuroblastoma-amplified sequence-like isoform X2 [Gigantopelta aegis]